MSECRYVLRIGAIGAIAFATSPEAQQPTAPRPGLAVRCVGPGTQGQMEAANVEERPFWNGGKMFAVTPAHEWKSCTGQFVASDRVVMTAAHCVMAGGSQTWYGFTMLQRAFDDGGGQSVQPDKICVPEGWAVYNNLAYDYAFMHMTTPSGAGYLGLTLGIPYQTWWAIGYPENWNNAHSMAKVEGSKGAVTPHQVQMLNNPMQRGSSGGAWIGDLTTARAAGNLVVGLNSWKTSETSTTMNSPPFTQDVADLLSLVQSGAGAPKKP